MRPLVAVVTTVAGRHEHLINQRIGLRNGDRRPDHHVVVAMGDHSVRPLLAAEPACTVVELHRGHPLPLAAARNLGAEVAQAMGARTLIFLDVDCVPSRGLVGRYARVAAAAEYRNGLLCGQVRYVPSGTRFDGDEETLASVSPPHHARPLLDGDRVLATTAYELFWSLSFALTSQAWASVGGFCESYVGYGGEDTDFAECARQAAVDMFWVGGADAYHQYHPVSDPPTEHLDEILLNARTFVGRWGWWPMQGWLSAFESAGLINFDPQTQCWARTSPHPLRDS